MNVFWGHCYSSRCPSGPCDVQEGANILLLGVGMGEVEVFLVRHCHLTKEPGWCTFLNSS